MLAIKPAPIISIGVSWEEDPFKDESTEVQALSALAQARLQESLTSGNAPAVQAWCELSLKQAHKRGTYRLIRVGGKLIPSPNS